MCEVVVRASERSGLRRVGWALSALGFVGALGLVGALRTARAEEAGFDSGKSHIDIRLPAGFASQSPQNMGSAFRGQWARRVAGGEILVTLWTPAFLGKPIEKPEGLAPELETSERGFVGGGAPDFKIRFERIGGAYGLGGYGLLGTAPGAAGECFYLVGVLDTQGYFVRVTSPGSLTAEDRLAILDFLRNGVRVRTPAADLEWTAEEVRTTWESSVGEKLQRSMKPVSRSAHYIVFTNTGEGKRFASRMEATLTRLQKLFPEGVAREFRLLPVFIFAKPAEFGEYYAKVAGRTIPVASQPSVCYGNACATYVGAANDFEVARMTTLQYFRTRLDSDAEGRWLRDSAAVYVATEPKEFARRVQKLARDSEDRPFDDLFSLEVNASGTEGTDLLHFGSTVVGFLCEGPWGPEHRTEFVRAVGRGGKSSRATVDGALRATYGRGVDDLVAAWKEWAASK